MLYHETVDAHNHHGNDFGYAILNLKNEIMNVHEPKIYLP